MATIRESMAIAVEHHRAGRLEAAEEIYRRILAVDPNCADVLHLLGAVVYQMGKHELAVEYIGRAIELKGTEGTFHHNLGNAFRAQGKLDEAIASYRRALALKPDDAIAHNNLGNALKDRGNLDEAIASYRRALALKPDYAMADNNLGNALKDRGNLDEAVACYRRTLALMPNCAEGHYNLGNALKIQGNMGEAIGSYRRALALKPDYAIALNNLGNALKDRGSLDEAVACYRWALEVNPTLAEAHNNLGITLQEQGKLDEAIACYRQALQYKRDYMPAISSLVHGLQHVCCWKELKRLSDRVVADVDADVNQESCALVSPFAFVTLSTPTTAEQQLRSARRWAESKKVKGKHRLDCKPTLNVPPTGDSKTTITMGYISGDFHSHATAWLIGEVLEKHDRGRFNVFGYSYGPDDGSAIRRRLSKGFDHFCDIRDLSFGEGAERIAADGVDILVDLKGYTQHARTEILALRPAPIQVNYLGYPGTMGASFMDYILVDDFVVPMDQQRFYTEKLVHLPKCYQANDSQREISPRTPSRSESGLPEEGFVFCCFNNSYKITPEVFDVWMRLLKAVPGSVLWLLEGNRFAPPNLRKEAELRGIAAERLVFASRRPLPEHLARHTVADLFLDTFPVNAHTTASDALWAGCPVLTIAGETFVSRVAGSLLRAVGLPELITGSLEKYESLALQLAQDRQQLAALRSRLASNRRTCSLFNGERFARELERAYLRMWEMHTSGECPRPFTTSQSEWTEKRVEHAL